MDLSHPKNNFLHTSFTVLHFTINLNIYHTANIVTDFLGLPTKMAVIGHVTSPQPPSSAGRGNGGPSIVQAARVIAVEIYRFQFLPRDAMHQRGLCRRAVAGWLGG